MGEVEERRVVYPFTAIVGQEKAKLALLIAAVNPLVGGVLLRGDKGTGKSTMVRALADVLPEIEVVADCPFNCNPRNPLEMCDWCYSRYKRGEELPAKSVRMRVVDLPLSVTVDRLVGSLDVERALREGVRALEPGLLAEANRNILYIDEVNLLDDYIADVLLDAAAMGWNVVEREGVSVKHPARFILVGSMNPEEGELRPQILDRFGLCVDVQAPMDPEVRAEIVRRVEEFSSDPESFYRRYAPAQEELRQRVARAKELLPRVEVSEDLLKLLAETVVELGIRTSRAEIVTVRAAKAVAALDGRTRVRLEDLKKAMELALPHRLKSKPFEKPPPLSPSSPPSVAPSNKGGSPGGSASGAGRSGSGGGEKVFDPSPEKPKLPRDEGGRKGLAARTWRGSRAEWRTVVGHPHGVPIYYTIPRGPRHARDIDLLATIKAAAVRCGGVGPQFRVEPYDIRVRVRRARVPRLTVLLLDSSGSMAVARRMSLAKRVAMELTERMYVKRDWAALVVFRGGSAHVLVPPTRRYVDIIDALSAVPTGGKTPLSSALYELLRLARAVKMKNRWTHVRAILITDGKANVPMGIAESLEEEITTLARALSRMGVSLEIYDTRPPGVLDFSRSYIVNIAEASGARVYGAG